VGGARRILDAGGVARGLDRLASSIAAGRRDDGAGLAVIGIRRRGVPLAERIAARMRAQGGPPLQTGALDITLYRDDLTLVADQPVVHRTEIPFPVDGLRVVLVDDVLYTGRTVRAAIDALFALGRPARIELAVLIDRGHRELPIQADHVAERVETQRRESVHVHLSEVDGEDRVEIEGPGPAGGAAATGPR
jgi:pyrimidine operon attenuation protein/uracil phosphoribosyltransferase